jgi:hypothetical protein
MSTQFILRRKYVPYQDDVLNTWPALHAIREQVKLAKVGGAEPDQDLLDELQRLETYYAGLPDQLNDCVRYGIYSDPHNEYSLLGICGIVAPAWRNLKAFPGKPSLTKENFTLADTRNPLQKILELVRNNQLGVYETRLMYQLLQEGKWQLEQNCKDLWVYWRTISAEKLTPERTEALIAHFNAAHSALSGVLSAGIKYEEPLLVRILY